MEWSLSCRIRTKELELRRGRFFNRLMFSIIINSSLIYFTFTESPNSILFLMLPVIIDVGNIVVFFFGVGVFWFWDS